MAGDTLGCLFCTPGVPALEVGTVSPSVPGHGRLVTPGPARGCSRDTPGAWSCSAKGPATASTRLSAVQPVERLAGSLRESAPPKPPAPDAVR